MPDSSATNPGAVSRRELLKWASAGAGAAAVGGATWLIGRDDTRSDEPAVLGSGDTTSIATSNTGLPTATSGTTPGGTVSPPPSTPAPASSQAVIANGDLGKRLLVVVEMDGGNDGLSMVVPYGMDAYYDLRQRTAIAAEDVLTIDDEVGYSPTLEKLHRRGAAIIEGVGAHRPDESHFEMLARWWNGDPDASGTFDSGFLGRLADAIGDPSAPAVAVSTSGGNSPALLSKKVSTMGLSSLGAAGYLAGASDDDTNLHAFQRGLRAYGAAGAVGESGYLERIRGSFGQAASFADSLVDIELEDGLRPGYNDGGLTRGLSLAMSLFLADQGVRIVHVPMNLDFDTHDAHLDRHFELMRLLDEGLEVFLDDVAANDLADRVLVMTTSEFGRRARDNGSNGLDHGTASTALMLGPVNVGRYGVHPSLTDLDDGNLKATVSFDEYYATVAEGWFGVPAGDVLGKGIRPLDGIINQ